MKDKLRAVYGKHYKQLVYLPIIIVLLAVLMLGYTYVQTGDIIDKDVSLKGGTTGTIYAPGDFSGLEASLLALYPEGDFTVRELSEFASEESLGVVVEVSTLDGGELEEALEEITGLALNADNFSLEFVGSSLGESFYRQMVVAIGLAFLFMALVVFITFRVFIPSFAVVFGAFGDMVCALAVMNLLGMQISTAGIAAILLLIGYSIDTDILLTTKMLKRKEGSMFDRLHSAMKTGLTMSITTIAALSVGYFVSSSLVLKQMFLIIIIGLIFDILITYTMNASLLVWYLKKKRGITQ